MENSIKTLKFKLNFESESYLVNVKNDAHKKLTWVSSHTLAVETGRYIGIERKNRHCIFCSQKQTETEYMYHVLLTCPIYRKIRNGCFINFAWPNITTSMSTENKRKQLRIAKLIYIAFKQRAKSIAQNLVL